MQFSIVKHIYIKSLFKIQHLKYHLKFSVEIWLKFGWLWEHLELQKGRLGCFKLAFLQLLVPS